jgi:hypothetical protein
MSVRKLTTVEVLLPTGASLSFVADTPFDFVRERILHEHDATLACIVAEDEKAASYSGNCHVPPGAYKAVLVEEAHLAPWSFSSWISSPAFEEHQMTLQLLVYAELQQTSGGKHKHINLAKVWKLANMLRLRGEIQRIRTSANDPPGPSTRGACRLLLQGTARLVKIFIRACTQVRHTWLCMACLAGKARGASDRSAHGVWPSLVFPDSCALRRTSVSFTFATRRTCAWSAIAACCLSFLRIAAVALALQSLDSESHDSPPTRLNCGRRTTCPDGTRTEKRRSGGTSR